MRPSTKTLLTISSTISRRIFDSFNTDTFGIAFANETLSDIEKLLDLDFLSRETGLIIVDGVTDYTLSVSNLRRITGIYPVQPSEVVPNIDNQIPFTEYGEFLRLGLTPLESGTVDITGTAKTGGPTGNSSLYDNEAGKIDSYEKDSLRGRICRVTHTNGDIEYKVIAKNDPTARTISFNGSLVAPALNTNAYLITDNFALVRYSRYISKFASKSDVADIPEDFESALRAGIAWRYYTSKDETSDETKQWESIYASELNSVKIDTSRISDTNFIRYPKSIPSFQ